MNRVYCLNGVDRRNVASFYLQRRHDTVLDGRRNALISIGEMIFSAELRRLYMVE